MSEYPSSDTAKRGEGTSGKPSRVVKVQRIHGEVVYSVETIGESKQRATLHGNASKEAKTALSGHCYWKS